MPGLFQTLRKYRTAFCHSYPYSRLLFVSLLRILLSRTNIDFLPHGYIMSSLCSSSASASSTIVQDFKSYFCSRLWYFKMHHPLAHTILSRSLRYGSTLSIPRTRRFPYERTWTALNKGKLTIRINRCTPGSSARLQFSF